MQAVTIQPELSLDERRAARKAAIAKFTDLRLQASKLLSEAEQVAMLSGLGDLFVQQMRAAGGVAGVVMYAMPLVPCPEDFMRLRDDLELVAKKIDPLIEAIGDEACRNQSEIRDEQFTEHFKTVILSAIDGNATYLLDKCAGNARDDDSEDQRADSKIKAMAD